MNVLSEALHAHARRKTYRAPANRNKVVGASEIGQCARRVWYAKHDGPRDVEHTDHYGASLRGSTYERVIWWPALRKRYGDDLLFAGTKQQQFTKGFLSARPDGLLINQPRDALAVFGVPDIGPGRCFIVECKTADPRSNFTKAKEENVFQTQVQMGLIREQTKYRPQWAVLTYTDASIWSHIHEFAVAFDPEVFQNAQLRAKKIITANSAVELAPEGYIAGGRECEHCPFSVACGRQRTDAPPREAMETGTPFAAEIAAMARKCDQLGTEADAAAIRLREAQTTIKDRLRERGVSRVEDNDVRVTWSQVKGRESYDQKALREAAAAAGVEVEQFSRVGEATDRLTIRISE
jgi:hypothetical protein